MIAHRRLYTEETFEQLQGSTSPEILRTNLGGVVLQLKARAPATSLALRLSPRRLAASPTAFAPRVCSQTAAPGASALSALSARQALGVDDVLGFPFIDPPPRGALVRSLELLYSLEALDDAGKLTAQGKAMARFPLEPMAAKALLAAQRERCAEDVCAVVAMLDTEGLFFNPKCVAGCGPTCQLLLFCESGPATQLPEASPLHPFNSPRDKLREAQAARERFHSSEGDMVMLLKIFRVRGDLWARTLLRDMNVALIGRERLPAADRSTGRLGRRPRRRGAATTASPSARCSGRTTCSPSSRARRSRAASRSSRPRTTRRGCGGRSQLGISCR